MASRSRREQYIMIASRLVDQGHHAAALEWLKIAAGASEIYEVPARRSGRPDAAMHMRLEREPDHVQTGSS